MQRLSGQWPQNGIHILNAGVTNEQTNGFAACMVCAAEVTRANDAMCMRQWGGPMLWRGDHIVRQPYCAVTKLQQKYQHVTLI